MAQTEEEIFLTRFMGLVSEKMGLRVRSQDRELLRRAVLARKKANRSQSLEDYYRLLDADSDKSALEQKELMALLMVGESYFFRDGGQFWLLKNAILPGLIELRKNERRLRVWSAGCSTGEEPYSIAILVDEMVPDRKGWEILILGTDIKRESIEKASSGVYGDWSFRMTVPGLLQRYFRSRGGLHELDPRIRDMVTFSTNDLLRDPYPDPDSELHDMDLIVCRNVFIYYSRKAVSEIVKKMTDTLREGGVLVTGHGELYSVSHLGLKPEIYPESVVYRRVSGLEAALSANIHETAELLGKGAPVRQKVRQRSAPAKPITAPPVKDSGGPDDFFQQAEARFKEGAYRETIEKAQKMLARNPSDFHALYLAAAAYANLGEHTSARDCLFKIIRADRLAAEPYYLLAHIAEENGHNEEAKEALRKAIYLKPTFVPAYLELAAIYENEGEAQRALRMRKSALEILGSLPQDATFEHYGDITVRELAGHVKKMAGENPV